MTHADSKQLDYFASNKKQNRRFFCQPALNLFEHFTVFQTIPHERYDIVRCLDKYFNRNTPENTEAEEFIPVLFKVVEVPWQSSETDSPKTADFPSLSEYELEYYDIWQLKVHSYFTAAPDRNRPAHGNLAKSHMPSTYKIVRPQEDPGGCPKNTKETCISIRRLP
ncbi:hypothetical protein NERG_01259 [Nematocida ausubeli]|uniref:Uncharacterized protein n=1 Tax=Nematocida ausubeli (strain ATCC PRA-371 / ERTm2) TaxID=1913371 RepID=H8ZC16_NEMA1|nr:hypothetical protein NERG_01259 [Nematocida ausubeli]